MRQVRALRGGALAALIVAIGALTIVYASQQRLGAGTEPGGSTAGDLAARVIDLVDAEHLLPVRDGQWSDPARYCARSEMAVSWSAPAQQYRHGAHLLPLGPAPTAGTTDVNGIVTCDGSTYAYVGFEATRTDAGWQVLPVPGD